MPTHWEGVIPAACTHFRNDQGIDVPATLRHLDILIDAGVRGVVMLGTVGENTSLEYQEKLDVLKATVEHLGGRIPVLSGVAENTTSLACRFADGAQAMGVNGLMVLPAMNYHADRREAIAHQRAVAESCDLPIMVYNNPVSYRVDMTPDMFAELTDVPNIVAIKESSDDPRRITDLANTCGDRFQLVCGVDDLVLEAVLLGATGWVSGLVNAFPRESVSLWQLATAGRWEEARSIYRWFTPLLHLDTHVKLVQYIKLVVQACGYGSELTRAPRLPLVGEERQRVLDLVQDRVAGRPNTAATSA